MSPSSKKRERDFDDAASAAAAAAAAAAHDNNGSDDGLGQGNGNGNTTSNFRNVSACNRCRTRKNRCDQKLPRCSGCERAKVRCVGFDPVSKRTIPRSYVYYLETRVKNLEALLQDRGIAFPPPEDDFAVSDAIKPGVNVPFPVQDDASEATTGGGGGSPPLPSDAGSGGANLDAVLREREENSRLDKLVSGIGMVSVQGTSDSRFLGSTSGISFARVVFAAVKSSVARTPSEHGSVKSSKRRSSDAPSGGGGGGGGGTSMRDSFFGLHTKPAIKPAPFPDKALGQRLVELYFEFANPQIPVLHRGEFMLLFERVYAAEPKKRTPRELYLLNIVFAMGSGIIMDSTNVEQSVAATESGMDMDPPTKKRQKTANQQHQPEEYHSSAVVHLESFLGSSPTADSSASGLEELQAVLLLAGLALLRPVAPGLWYIVGVAVRLAVDLGLHFEDIDPQLDGHAFGESEEHKSLGRKQWTRDLRRRLWWSVYAFDRLVSTCVGRPFGITDQVVTTEFPSMLDDKHITTSGFLKPPDSVELPSYKLVAHHYLRLRLLQSEILQVLQHRQAEQTRSLGANRGNAFMHTSLASPFLEKFDTFREWRYDVDRRLLHWRDSAPKQPDTGVAFTPLFLELNYWQAIVMLYRQSLSVPEPLASELSPSTGDDVQSPGRVNYEAKEDEEFVFMKVAQAGQAVMKVYRQLHRLKLVNYTFLATHHLFMSGISFLYAIWHSPLVRSQLTLDDVDFTVLVATSVLSDLVDKCPPAEACRDAFVRMSKATISMVERTTGFGSASTLSSQSLSNPDEYFPGRRNQPHDSNVYHSPEQQQHQRKPPKRQMTMPKFDYNLKDLFSDEEIANRPLAHQPRLHAFQRRKPPAHPSFPSSSSSTRTGQPSSTPFALSNPTPFGTLGDTAASAQQQQQQQQLQQQQQQQQQHQPQPFGSPASSNTPFNPQSYPSSFAPTSLSSSSRPDLDLDDLDFLTTFQTAGSDHDANAWTAWTTAGGGGGGGGDSGLDLGFGTGGAAGYGGGGGDGGEWDPSGVDLMGGFFFGDAGGGGGGGGGMGF